MKTTHVGSQQGYRKHSEVLAQLPPKHAKMTKQMQEENLTHDSTDVFYDIIQKYEKRLMESTLVLSTQMLVH
jgi:hypothetical protein